MTYFPIRLQPGIVTEMTKFAAEGNYVDGNLVRFRYGQPQQLGGWIKFSTTLAALDGICRQLRSWHALDGSKWLAIGTNRRLYVSSGGLLFDITPYRLSGNLTNPFSTLLSSPIVTVTSAAHGFSTGDIAYFSGSTAIGGLTINGYYVVSVTGVNSYTIIAATNATSTVSSAGGTVAYAYLIPCGPSDQTTGFGWGAGTYSQSTWGTPRTSGGVPVDIGQWTFDNWGEDLIANRYGQGIFVWSKSGGVGTVAQLITQAPQICDHILVTPDRIMLAYGCSDTGATTNFDPLSVKWATQGDYTNWTPSATSTAGFYRINAGNKIVTAKVVGQTILIWTDVDLYQQQPLPAPAVFGFQLLATGTSPLSKNAVAVVGNIAFWMGNAQFYTFTANSAPLPCTVLRYVFGNLNAAQGEKIFAGTNYSFNEIWWFYPSANSNEIDSVVIYNYVESWWSIGKIQRTAWLDISSISPSNPLSVDASGAVWSQENGDLNDTQTMGSYLTSGPVDIAHGDEVVVSNRCIPDFLFTNPSVTVQLTFTAMNYPQSAEVVTKGPYLVGASTRKIDFRIRGRQVQLRIDGGAGYWQAGAPRLDIVPDGLR